MRVKLVLIPIVIATLSGCGTSPAPVPSSTANSITLSDGITSGATPQVVVEPSALKLGTVHTGGSAGDGVQYSVVASSFKRVKNVEAVKVRVCNVGKTAFEASSGPWALQYGEATHAIMVSGGGTVAPEYPYWSARVVTPSKCITGWINFDEIPGQKPTGVQYQPEGLAPTSWKLQ